MRLDIPAMPTGLTTYTTPGTTGESWHFEIVDGAPGVGSYAALALDEGGYPRISYSDIANNDLKYAYTQELYAVYHPLNLRNR
jgi:hypothetical protein